MQNTGWWQIVVMLQANNGILYQRLHELKGVNLEKFFRRFTYRATILIAFVWWIPIYILSIVVAFMQTSLISEPIQDFLILIAIIVGVLVLSIFVTFAAIYRLYKQGYYEWEFKYNRK